MKAILRWIAAISAFVALAVGGACVGALIGMLGTFVIAGEQDGPGQFAVGMLMILVAFCLGVVGLMGGMMAGLKPIEWAQGSNKLKALR